MTLRGGNLARDSHPGDHAKRCSDDRDQYAGADTERRFGRGHLTGGDLRDLFALGSRFVLGTVIDGADANGPLPGLRV